MSARKAEAGVERRPPAVTDYEGAAAYLGITVRQLKDMQYRRDIPFYKVGRQVRFRYSDLDAHLKANRTEAAS